MRPPRNFVPCTSPAPFLYPAEGGVVRTEVGSVLRFTKPAACGADILSAARSYLMEGRGDGRRPQEGDAMSELADAFQSLCSALRQQYIVLKPLVLQQLRTLRWNLHLSLLELRTDLARPFRALRTYSDHILLLDSPDAQGWQVALQVADDECRVWKVQHLEGRKMSHGVRLASSKRKRSGGAETAPAKEPIVHLTRLPRPPGVAQELILEEVHHVLALDKLDDPEWVLRDAVRGAKRRCLREGAGMEWCDVWLAEVVKKRPGMIAKAEKRKEDGRAVTLAARFVPS